MKSVSCENQKELKGGESHEPSELHDIHLALAEKILAQVLPYRRVVQDALACSDDNCSNCSTWHLPKIIRAIKEQLPITFVLPAFPGKSPNPRKVLSHLPDCAEELALKFLADLTQRIQRLYQPGAKIILCSDGRVFSDVVGMQESHVTAYQEAIDQLILDLSLPDISTFNLDEVYQNLSFDDMRQRLMLSYGKSLDLLKKQVKAGSDPKAAHEEREANRMYCGITRFLYEDALTPDRQESNTSIQKKARLRAYEVIRRSNAWSELVAELFPRAVRLSIHPQECGSKKLGIRLVGNESWMTPWHGVAVEREGVYHLMKRSDAESAGYKLVFSEKGLPSYFRAIKNHKANQTGL